MYFCLPATTEAGFGSGTEEETSGYESEGGHSLSPSAHTECSAVSSPSSPPLGRRPRTAFTAEQICSMERAFKRNAYLGTQDKAELCKKLSLSDKQVKLLTEAFCDWSNLIFKKCLHPVGKFSFMNCYQPFRSETGSRTGGWSWRGRCRMRWLMPVRQMLSLSSCLTLSYRPTDPGPTPGLALPQQQ